MRASEAHKKGNNMKISIHRALAELKLIDSKIEKKIGELQATAIIRKSEKANSESDIKRHAEDCKSTMDSIESLINRKAMIKSKVIESNSKTIVEIGGKKYTVADAISNKSIVHFKDRYANALKSSYAANKRSLEQKNEVAHNEAISMAEKALGKDAAKSNPEDAKLIMENYESRYMYELIDPCNANDKATKLQEEIDAFNTDVDAVLSESNALTTIEID